MVFNRLDIEITANASGMELVGKMRKERAVTFVDPTPLYKLADRPEWLLGDEEGANKPRKKFFEDEILFGLVSLTFYCEANATMGFQLLYNIASGQPKTVCERLFYPEIRIERFLRKHNLPLFSLESKLSAQDFDILAFSIFHIPEYLNFLEILSLSGIPYKTADRLDGRFPLIIAGGIFTVNPEPLAAHCDCICIGEADTWLIDFLDYYRKNRKLWECSDRDSKLNFLRGATEIEGTYVPVLTKVSYDGGKKWY